MENKNDKIINYSNVTLSKLMEVVNIESLVNHSKFEEWFSYKYKINEEESSYLEKLIIKNQIHLQNYNEISLTAKFIAPILNKIDFTNKKIKEWYGYKLEGRLNDYTLTGSPDYLVATGIEVPKKPFFFLQEYKKALNPHGNPEYQVVAEMLVAMTLNKKIIIQGSYIVGQFWKFVILEKLENGNYEYFVSNAFDSLNLEDLKLIYKNLQAVKFLYCK